MSALVVHVGPHKTGSTALQEFMYEHREELGRSGVSYPVICPEQPSRINHNDLAAAMLEPDLTVARRYIEELTAQSEGCDQILISGEEFSNCLNGKLDQGLSLFEVTFPTRYVFVSRPDVDRFVSAIIHSLASKPRQVLEYRRLSRYLQALSGFSQRQRQFFEARGALVLDFFELRDEGIGSGFLRRVFGLRFVAPEYFVDQSRRHLPGILDASDALKAEIASFFQDSAVNDALRRHNGDDSTVMREELGAELAQEPGLSRAIRRCVERELARLG